MGESVIFLFIGAFLSPSILVVIANKLFKKVAKINNGGKILSISLLIITGIMFFTAPKGGYHYEALLIFPFFAGTVMAVIIAILISKTKEKEGFK